MNMAATPSAWKLERVLSAASAFIAAQREQDADLIADTEAWALTLASETDAVELLEKIVHASLDARAFAEAIDARIDDLTVRRDRYRRQAEAGRATALAVMEALDLKKHVAPDFTLSIRTPTPGVAITDESRLPASCLRVTTSPDKKAIGERMAAGETIPGAEWRNGAPGITIRIK